MAKKAQAQQAELSLVSELVPVKQLVKDLPEATTKEAVVGTIGVLLDRQAQYVDKFLSNSFTFPDTSKDFVKVENAVEFQVAQEAYKELSKASKAIEEARKEASALFDAASDVLIAYQKHKQQPFQTEMERLTTLGTNFLKDQDDQKRKQLESIQERSKAASLANEKLLGLEQQIVDYLNQLFETAAKNVLASTLDNESDLVDQMHLNIDDQCPDDFAMLANKFVMYYQIAWEKLVEFAGLVAGYNSFALDTQPTWTYKIELAPDIDLSGVDTIASTVTHLEPIKGISKKLSATCSKIDSETLSAVTKAYIAYQGDTSKLIKFMLDSISKEADTDNPPTLPNVSWEVKYGLTAR